MQSYSDRTISFEVSFIEPQAHYVEITIHISGFGNDFIDLKMPTWTPGSYLIREFSRHVERFCAQTSGGTTLHHEKTAKNTWRITHKGENITVRYSVYGFEQSVRTNFIDDTHAFISPAATFMYIDGHLDLPSSVTIILPSFWSKISTGLEKTEQPNTFLAPNFDILFDCPIEVGNQDVWTFEAAGVWHEFAMVGKGNYDKDNLTRDIAKIVEEETRLWGSNPNDRYVFITHNTQNGTGGLEHLNSTVLGASRHSYQNLVSYHNFLGLVAHEYFHLWLAKRLRPLALGPFDYEKENYTSSLWIVEGFTSYYDNLITRRCGFRDEEDYLQMLAVDFNTVYNRPGHEVQSVALSSFDTWIKHYRPDENSHNTSISYYNKGAMLAVALDIAILDSTSGERRLDDVLRAAYHHFYIHLNRGFEESEFKDLTERIAGIQLDDIFNAVHETTELDFNAYFNKVGYEIVDLNFDKIIPSIGIKVTVIDSRIYIKSVDRGSGAWEAGLSANDEIIAVNGIRIDPAAKELETVLQRLSTKDTLDLMVARDALIRNIRTPIKSSDKKNFVIRRTQNATAQQRHLGNLWLSITE